MVHHNKLKFIFFKQQKTTIHASLQWGITSDLKVIQSDIYIYVEIYIYIYFLFLIRHMMLCMLSMTVLCDMSLFIMFAFEAPRPHFIVFPLAAGVFFNLPFNLLN